MGTTAEPLTTKKGWSDGFDDTIYFSYTDICSAIKLLKNRFNNNDFSELIDSCFPVFTEEP